MFYLWNGFRTDLPFFFYFFFKRLEAMSFENLTQSEFFFK